VFDADNHQLMTDIRQQKIDLIAKEIPKAVPYGKASGNLLVVSWGGTYGAVRSAVEKAKTDGLSVSHLQLRHLNPFPVNLGDLMLKFQKVLVPELNSGQLSFVLRSKYLIDIVGLNKVEGQPFSTQEILNKITEMAGN
jgi:2-oxoglutarate ferredoxin oxidoreductase subunit alpha